jgi:hypothetical protein
VDIDNPPEAYFEAMRRLRPEPPDKETVERIVEIFREWHWKQDSESAAARRAPLDSATKPSSKRC